MVPAGAGRFAPSPTGDFHLGNLRTAVLAWAFARYSGRAFFLRFEDLDERASIEARERQLEDLASLGLDWDEPVLYQQPRLGQYQAALADLASRELIYECYCSRKDIQSAPSAPHQPPGSYPGTCAHLTAPQRAAGRAKVAELGKAPALRVRAIAGAERTITDALHGAYTGPVDDFVLRRGDGVFAYNLVCVVDDAFQGVDQVTRADDLLSSAPRQAYLADLLGHGEPTYIHVPLARNAAGDRLAKRDGAVTWRQLRARGQSPAEIIATLAVSLGLGELTTAVAIGEALNVPALLSGARPPSQLLEPWIVRPLS